MVDSDLAHAFRHAMRRLAATVTVITTAEAGERGGITATAVTSVSTDPATLLACVNQSSTLHGQIALGSLICVNLLRHIHADVSRAFSGQLSGVDRFAVGDWGEDAAGVPYLIDAQANLFCTVKLAVPYATHTIFIVEVSAIRLHDEIAPLIYQDGLYVTGTPLKSGT